MTHPPTAGDEEKVPVDSDGTDGLHEIFEAQGQEAVPEEIPQDPQDSQVDALEAAHAQAAEHLSDLQRVQAEYVNYRKRVDRDREQVAAIAQASVIESLLGVLDDIHAAREHGDLDGPFGSIAEKLETSLAAFGWESFGAVDEAFDPEIHEALATTASQDVTEATVTQVAQPGHRLGARIIRPARVIVAQPE